MAADPRGHTLLTFDAEPIFVIACTTCGKYGSFNFGGLLEPCQGFRTKNGQQHLTALRAGRHPTRSLAGYRIGHAVPFAF